MSGKNRPDVGLAAMMGACACGWFLSGCSGQIARSPEDIQANDPARGQAGAQASPNTQAPAAPDNPATEMPTDKSAETPACEGLGSAGAPLPLRRLDAHQVQRSVAAILGADIPLAVPDEHLFHYRSNISTAIDSSGARAYLDFAEQASTAADLAQCAEAGCLAWLLDEIAPLLFRRPLPDEQRARYQALFEAGQADGARWVLQALLQSPSFLYLDEVVEPDGYLDDYSLAARMALVLWGSNPDAALLARAAEGRLSTAEQVRQEAQRMLADPRSEGGLRDFVDQWLELHRLDEPDARPDLSALGPEVVGALRTEPVRLLQAALERGEGLPQLLTTAETAALPELEPLYGEDIVARTAGSHMLDPARRAGILSLPGVMAALAHANATSPTLRGYTVLSGLLCSPPPPPPAGISVTLPDVGPDATARERLEAHFSSEACAACHRSMDGIGFAFESIDWLGRSRTREHGRPIDDVSSFELGSEEVTVDGVRELSAQMAASADVAACVARQWARYASGVPETPEAECLLARMGEQVREQAGLREMMLTFLSSDWFRRGHGGGM